MSTFTILLAGSIEANATLRAAVAGTRVIAADAGIRHAEPLGVHPELWVGDFDSAEGLLADVEREILPTEKDRTDGEAAIEAARRRGANSLLLVGALGGRMDHAFSHLVVALRLASEDLSVSLFDGRERGAPLLPGRHAFDAKPGAQFSLLKFGAVSGLSIRGAKYPLSDVTLPFFSILTQSNEALGRIEIELETGMAILLLQERAEVH